MPIVLRVPLLRRLVLRLPEDTRVRREVLTRAIVWSYQQFNATGRLPQQLWTSDFVLNQTATMLGTAGTFHGRERSQDVITELAEAFDDVRFDPEGVLNIAQYRFLAAVRFSGVGAESGIRTDQLIAHSFTLDAEAGLVSRLDVYWELPEALKAEGLQT
ncbi:MAG: hypothetical protein H0V85_04590 [Thermoleophilaceae bacterium]|nr:hypothetical protein [Thermoleophilaceae bacterium]